MLEHFDEIENLERMNMNLPIFVRKIYKKIGLRIKFLRFFFVSERLDERNRIKGK